LEYSRVSRAKRKILPVNFEHVLEEALLNLNVQIKETKGVVTHDHCPQSLRRKIKGSTFPKSHRKRN
jgi:hypothetical protein